MGRVLPLVFLLSLTASAQFYNLVTTNDGGALYLSTNFHVKGASEFGSSNIYRLLPGRDFELVDHVDCSRPLIGVPRYCSLFYPDVSGDGRIVVYTAIGSCTGGSSCILAKFEWYSGRLLGATLPSGALYYSTIRISRNGRYVLGASPNPRLADLFTGSVIELPGESIGDAYQTVTDTGAVLRMDPQGPILYQAGSTVRLALSRHPLTIRISADGSRIVYETSDGPKVAHQIIAYDVASGSETFLALGFAPWLSNDGQRVIYQAGSPSQVYLASNNGASIFRMTGAPEGVTTAVLSGFGNTIYALTELNRILEIDTASGAVRQLTDRVPYVDDIQGGWAPGSLIRLTGRALTDAQGAASVRVGDLEAPTLVRPPAVYFQIPWEYPLGPGGCSQAGHLSVAAEPGSLFEQANALYVCEQEIAFIRDGLDPVISHQDFHGPVTADDPAVAGEILHFWVTGLGAVDRPIATGEVTPIGPLFRVTNPPTCQLGVPAPMPVSVEFAGLAPTLLGIYQLSLRMPMGFSTTTGFLTCQVSFGTMWFSTSAAVPFRP